MCDCKTSTGMLHSTVQQNNSLLPSFMISIERVSSYLQFSLVIMLFCLLLINYPVTLNIVTVSGNFYAICGTGFVLLQCKTF